MIASRVGYETISYMEFMRNTRASLPVYVPVDLPGPVVLRLQHVIGVPSTGGVEGVPVSKLQVLDLLIERFIKLSQRQNEVPPVIKEDLSAEEVDDLILSLEERLHDVSVSHAQAPVPPPGIKTLTTGVVLNLSA
ncbi:hypothetical protein Spith_1731 [Spirochaeta thermophila DSM 6578]|uniref:Uncharacterized protein n=1 Tax=Winmispira thermophila (strain ATCC 700085 / DSM 6578 / Z-1203) TaxID=869211 RepID=G0GBY0_WINT7|nr:hypothetical protein [Spirochaeta thermophila]AEJ61991.1 hypothetical protein Spith_1731 [Spirochaeta thermophila DSM 6578]